MKLPLHLVDDFGNRILREIQSLKGFVLWKYMISLRSRRLKSSADKFVVSEYKSSPYTTHSVSQRTWLHRFTRESRLSLCGNPSVSNDNTRWLQEACWWCEFQVCKSHGKTAELSVTPHGSSAAFICHHSLICQWNTSPVSSVFPSILCWLQLSKLYTQHQ